MFVLALYFTLATATGGSSQQFVSPRRHNFFFISTNLLCNKMQIRCYEKISLLVVQIVHISMCMYTTPRRRVVSEYCTLYPASCYPICISSLVASSEKCILGQIDRERESKRSVDRARIILSSLQTFTQKCKTPVWGIMEIHKKVLTKFSRFCLEINI